MEFILRLRADGYHVGRIHCDRGHEFDGAFRKWARSRGIYITKTAGDDPQGNGRAEVTVSSQDSSEESTEAGQFGLLILAMGAETCG
jgi:hypothetical protein